VGHIVLTADRGLCGAYNSTVIRAAEASIREQAAHGRDYSLVLVGRKAESYFRFRGYSIDAVFTGFSDQPRYEDAQRVGAAATAAFVEERTDLVEVVYTRFLSAGRQEVVRQTLMPVARQDLDTDATGEEGVRAAYEFEPSPEGILDLLLPRYVDARIYAALLNAAASEHAARQRAMSAATDNAADLITNLTRVMNRARQDAITTEIMEIVGGAEALRQAAAAEPDYLADTIERRQPDLFALRTTER
jgi:F-type H+-transporting ATPase subunit gamma